jgi:hypothetical protein
LHCGFLQQGCTYPIVRYLWLSFDNTVCIRISFWDSDPSTYLIEYAGYEQQAYDSRRMLTALCSVKYKSGQLPAHCGSATHKATRWVDHCARLESSANNNDGIPRIVQRRG